jgi:hypothetical protein
VEDEPVSCAASRAGHGDRRNLLNSAAALSYNQAFIRQRQMADTDFVMSARFATVSAQLDF